MYSTREDVKSILKGAVSQNGETWEGTGATLSNEQIDDDIKNADSQIDGALGKRYSVPFDENNVPQVIKSLSADIAQYLADMRYRTSREYESQNYPSIMRYQRARELLEFIRTGDYKIPLEDVSTVVDPLVIHAYPDPPMIEYYEYFTPPRRQF